MDCSLLGSSIHGIFQARMLEWVAISFSRGSSQPRDWTQISRIVGRHFTIWATREVTIEYLKQWIKWCQQRREKGRVKKKKKTRSVILYFQSDYIAAFSVPKCIGLAKKFIWVFLWDAMKHSIEIFHSSFSDLRKAFSLLFNMLISY